MKLGGFIRHGVEAYQGGALMRQRGVSTHSIIGVVSAIFLTCIPLQTAEAFSISFWRSRRPWYRTRTVVVLPAGAIPIQCAGNAYYYRRGEYYRRSPRGYAVVPAPIGAVIPTLPDQHRTMLINGITYHEYDGVYYRGGPSGYTVVPIAQATSATTGAPVFSTDPVGSAVAQSTAVINVPNKNGSYTPVTLQLASSGMYIGPQGEVYPNLPTAQQLQSMYGK